MREMREINFYLLDENYGFLSNFDRTPVIVDEDEDRIKREWVAASEGTWIEYPTNENYYQSEKAIDKKMKRWIASAPTPYAAMMAGRSLRKKEMVHNWDERKVAVMKKGLRAKFRNPTLRQKLLDTGDAILHEDSPTDMFWGKKGADMLGKLLMEVRDEIRAGKL